MEPTSPAPLRIAEAELADPKVDAALARQGSFGMEPARSPDGKTSLLYRPWFALLVAGALGGLAGWAAVEPFVDDGLVFEGRVEELTPDPGGGSRTDMRVSGVEVIVREGRTRLLADGEPIGIERFRGARRVGVRCAEVALPTGPVLVAYEVRLLRGEADPGSVSLAAIRLRRMLLGMLVFPVVAALVGLFIAAADGLLSRAWRRAALCGIVGLASGLTLGLVSSVIGEILYTAGRSLVVRLEGDEATSMVAFLAQMTARGLAWAVTGVTMGLGQGIALRSKRMAFNGVLGGVVGALVGGMLFDPIDRLLHAGAFGGGSEVSRAIGFLVIGLTVGLMIGIVELLAREAWLKMLAGPLAGKEFVLFKNPTTIGSSPKADVYLFKDPEVEPSHAQIHRLAEGFEVVDATAPGAQGRVFLNGQPVRRSRLEQGDQIRIGKTILSFSLSEK